MGEEGLNSKRVESSKPGAEPQVVFATSKTDPFIHAPKILKVDNFERRDPELPHYRMNYREESKSPDPVQVVIEKMMRIKQGLKLEGKEHHPPITASDVTFFLNGEQMHQIVRSPEEKQKFRERPWEYDEARLQAIKRYAQPFEPVWHNVYGMMDEEGRIKIAQVKITCDVIQGLDKYETYPNFLPTSNAHIRLVEILRARGVKFKVFFEDSTGAKDETPMELPGEIAEQYIVAKILDSDIFWLFLRNDPIEMQRMGYFEIALLTMADLEQQQNIL